MLDKVRRLYPDLSPADQLEEAIVQAIGEDKASRQAASQVAQMYVDRYGSVEGAKRAIATDPAGVMADISTVLTGGSTVASRFPRVASKLSQTATMVDPLALAAKSVVAGAKGAGKVAENVLGVTTGVPVAHATQAKPELRVITISAYFISNILSDKGLLPVLSITFLNFGAWL